jgi:hypothetical protein
LGGHHDAVLLGRIQVNGARLEVDMRGVGEPILFVQTALSADELLPIARQPVLADGFQTNRLSPPGLRRQ